MYCGGKWEIGSIPVNEAFVLEKEKGKLVMAGSTIKTGKKSGVSEEKIIATLKSHSDAERRRRERINSHLATLKDLIPFNEKMDKATLLAEVINQVKHLKTSAAQACKDLHIPLDSDEVKVEIVENEPCNNDGRLFIRASLCCDYRPELLSRIRKAINGLSLEVLNCEISTLGGRVKSVFLVEPQRENCASWEAMTVCVQDSLSGILKDVSESAEFDQQLMYPQKRRRVLSMESSCL